MTLPAARLTDMHVCPMQTPAVPPIPHVGGPITGPGAQPYGDCRFLLGSSSLDELCDIHIIRFPAMNVL